MSATTTKPGLHFVLIAHDPWCPGARGRAAGCICNATARLVSETEFVARLSHDMSRRQRREAERRARRGKA